MSFWRTLSSILSRSEPVRGQGCGPCEGSDPAFSADVTALGAKLARADGQAVPIEFDAFLEAFPPDERARADIRRLYGLARETTHGFESYAKRLAKRYAKCPHILEAVVTGLVHVARSDGAVTGDERAYLKRVAQLFSLSPLTLRRIEADVLGLPADDPYAILGVAPDAADEAVKAAWRKALAQHHPDRIAGDSEEAMARAHEISASLNGAYDAVMRERRALLLVAAA